MNNLDTLTIDSLNAFKPGQLVQSRQLKDVIVDKDKDMLVKMNSVWKVEDGKKLIMVFTEFVESLGPFLSDPIPYTYKVISEPTELERLTGSRTLFIQSPNHTGKLFIIFDEGKVVGPYVIYEDKDKDNLKPNDKKRVFILVERPEIQEKISNALSPSRQPTGGGRRLSRKYKKSNKRIKSSKRSYRKPKSRRNRRQCK